MQHNVLKATKFINLTTVKTFIQQKLKMFNQTPMYHTQRNKNLTHLLFLISFSEKKFENTKKRSFFVIHNIVIKASLKKVYNFIKKIIKLFMRTIS